MARTGEGLGEQRHEEQSEVTVGWARTQAQAAFHRVQRARRKEGGWRASWKPRRWAEPGRASAHRRGDGASREELERAIAEERVLAREKKVCAVGRTGTGVRREHRAPGSCAGLTKSE
jgi:hypothetical protein